jgi:hypothetical protein
MQRRPAHWVAVDQCPNNSARLSQFASTNGTVIEKVCEHFKPPLVVRCLPVKRPVQVFSSPFKARLSNMGNVNVRWMPENELAERAKGREHPKAERSSAIRATGRVIRIRLSS